MDSDRDISALTETELVGEPMTENDFDPSLNTQSPPFKRTKISDENSSRQDTPFRRDREPPGVRHNFVIENCFPKDAVTCLEILRPGQNLNAEPHLENDTLYNVSVDIDGEKYQGYGSDYDKARESAAEIALSKLSPDPAYWLDNHRREDTKEQDDKDCSSPEKWMTMISYALYKLVNNTWNPPPPSIDNSGDVEEITRRKKYKDNVDATNCLIYELDSNIPKETQVNSNESVLFLPPNNQLQDGFVQSPAKMLPPDAETLHPVMLLHQMKPGIDYTVDHSDSKYFVSTKIDNQIYQGCGLSIKKAKFCLATNALKLMFNIDSTYTQS